MIYFIKVHFNIQYFNHSSIVGRIDQVNQVLELENDQRGVKASSRYNALQKWSEQLTNIQYSIASKIVI